MAYDKEIESVGIKGKVIEKMKETINCPNCGSQMIWDGKVYVCSECGLELDEEW